jgi:hypothetical protein
MGEGADLIGMGKKTKGHQRALSSTLGQSQKAAACKWEGRHLTKNWTMLAPWFSRTVRKKFCCLSPSIYGMLF